MEHQKVLRISTIVLATAIFSLVIAKPGMAYARSHLDIPWADIHEYADDIKHHDLGSAAGRYLLGTLGPIGDVAKEMPKWVAEHSHCDLSKGPCNHVDKYRQEQEWQRSHGGDSGEEDHSSDNSGGGGGSSHEDHGSSDNSGSSDHDFSPSGGGNGGENTLPSEGSGGSGGGSDNGGSDNGGSGGGGGDEGGGSGGGY